MLIGVGLVAVIALYLLTSSGAALEVETARVVRDTLQVTVSEEGRTRVREQYVVAAPVTGRLTRIPLDEGDAVREGTLVARIYPMPEDPRNVGIARAQIAAAEARRREAAARVEEAEGRAIQAEREAERSRRLVADSILSRQEGEQSELAAAAARQQVSAARSALRAADAEIAANRAALVGSSAQDDTGPAVTVTAPSTGRVLRVLEESERVVQAGTPLVEIGDAGGIEVVVDVLSEDAVRITPGAPVLLEEWGGDRTLYGEVRLVEPAAFTEVSALGVEEQRVNVIVDVFDAPSTLGAGYRVEAQIVTWTGGGVLTVPTSALFQQDGSWTVFVVREGKAVRRTVGIGHRSAEAAEVLGGLAEGDEVILFPSDQIEEGVQVRSRSEEAP